MCRIDDADPCDFFVETEHKARKTHKCEECGRTINPDEKYIRHFSKSYGDVVYFCVCKHCNIASNWLMRECHGYVSGEVFDELVEHWKGQKDHNKELTRLIYGMRRKWMKRNKELMPLPIVNK